MKNTKKFFSQQASQIIDKSNTSVELFKQFLFAPNLLTFVISVVVGNSFGNTVKELVNLVFGLIDFIRIWIFSPQHTAYYNRITDPFATFSSSLLTTILISLIVFLTIRFINTALINDPTNKWGYNQSHADNIKLHKQNEETIELQRQILAELQKLNHEEKAD